MNPILRASFLVGALLGDAAVLQHQDQIRLTASAPGGSDGSLRYIADQAASNLTWPEKGWFTK